MTTDFSVAPEIAQLATSLVPAGHLTAPPRTDGRIAGDLADLAADPQRWWHLVRFDQSAPVRVPLPGTPGAWLVILPPGATADCDCRQATALAGEALELAADGTRRPLRPGRIRVHGTPAPHRVRAVGPGYSVMMYIASNQLPF